MGEAQASNCHTKVIQKTSGILQITVNKCYSVWDFFWYINNEKYISFPVVLGG